MIISGVKAQGFMSNLDQTITTKLRGCCSVQVNVYAMSHPCCPCPSHAWSGCPGGSKNSQFLCLSPQTCYRQKILPNFNSELTLKGPQPQNHSVAWEERHRHQGCHNCPDSCKNRKLLGEDKQNSLREKVLFMLHSKAKPQ